MHGREKGSESDGRIHQVEARRGRLVLGFQADSSSSREALLCLGIGLKTKMGINPS